MRKLLIGLGVLCFGCSDNTGEIGNLPDPDPFTRLTLTSDVTIDSSQVLFFRQLAEGDSLVCQIGIEGPKADPDEHIFSVPAGYYQLVTIGNGEPEHIRFMGGQRTKDSTLIEYTGGVQPPDLHYGSGYVKAGEQKRIGSAFLILTCRIALTIQQVPQEVKRIRAVLENTAEGVYLNLVIRKKPAIPPIFTELTELQPGTSPTIHFKSFPSVSSTDSSFLNVSCFDAADNLLYQGKSVSFRLVGSEDIQVSCRFQSVGRTDVKPVKKNSIVSDFLLQ